MEIEKPKIVIVDDDEDIAEVTKSFLKRRGFDAITAYDGESGLTLIRTQPPNLILLDLMLPGIDGYEVCRRIKEDNSLWHIPIIYFTAKGDFLDKIAGLKSGADDYVTKPFEPEELLARIWMILNRTSNVLDANPLTKLPGNNAIQKQMTLRLESTNKFAIAHLDVDYFKSYNDEYGFKRGDEAIQLLAQLLVQTVSAKGEATDFVGHIGGDDFVLLSIPERIDTLCKEIIRQFDEHAPKLYDEKDRQRGYIVLKNRQGQLQEFPFISLSIAVVTNEKRVISHIGEVNSIAAELKKFVKTLPGSNYVKDRRDLTNTYTEAQSRTLEGMNRLILEEKIYLETKPIFNTLHNVQYGNEVIVRGMISTRVLPQDEIFNHAIEMKLEGNLGKTQFQKLHELSPNLKPPLCTLVWTHPLIFMSVWEKSNDTLTHLSLNPAYLIYQLRASDLLNYDKLNMDVIENIHAMGARASIALAWGSPVPLTLLTQVKPQYLYLDASFTNNIETDPTQQTTLKVLMEMAQVLNCHLMVSGVDTLEKRQFLQKFGVTLMLGEIFSEKTEGPNK